MARSSAEPKGGLPCPSWQRFWDNILLPVGVGPELGCEEVRSCLLLVPFEVFFTKGGMFVWVTSKYFGCVLESGPFVVGLMPEGHC